MAEGFLGIRGSKSFVDGQRPKNWRQQIFKLYPNGMAPLTAILSMIGSTKVDDPEFNWWTQEQNSVAGAIGGIYSDAALTDAYDDAEDEGTVIYVVVTTVLANRIRAGHQILLRYADDWRVDVVGKVTSVTRGGVNSTLAVRLLENDDNSTDAGGTATLAEADNFKIIGNINPEGGEMPDAIALNPVKVYNYTQIFRTPLSITRTARKTRLRTGNAYQKAKAEALEMHSWEMELAFLWGIMTENTGDNGMPERTTAGVINFIRRFAPANCDDYTLNVTYSSDDWLTSGETWMKYYLEQIFRYGAENKLCLCGSGFLLGVDALAQQNGQIQLTPGQKRWGMEIREWLTPFGSITMKTHPLFSYDETTRNMGIIIEPKEMGYRYIDDTSFYGESTSKKHSEGYGARRLDGSNEEWLTECGLEFGLPQKCAVLNGVGLDNEL
jgi:hypothetical protein